MGSYVLHVHIRWSMYYMFTSGGQCTTCSHQVINVLHVHIRWPMYYMFTSGGQCTTYVLFIQSHCRLANLLSLLVTSTQPPGHTTALDGLWSVAEGASIHGLELTQHFPFKCANGMQETVINLHIFCPLQALHHTPTYRRNLLSKAI